MSHSSERPQWQTGHVWRLASVLALATLILVAVSAASLGLPSFSALAAGELSVEIIAAYNLVVDSNVLAPSTYAPSVATVGGKICNTTGATVAGVQAFIGDYKNGSGSTPGIYPARNSATDPAFSDPLQYQYLQNTGSYAFTHVGGQIGTGDASRYIGTLGPGQCQVQYWHFTYPRRSNGAGPTYTPNTGDQPVWGQTRLTSDDLALGFDIWTTASGGLSTNEHQTMTMRNEISAMANKIMPNPDGAWFNTINPVTAGDIITTNGILYELGVINQGFDNDGDFTPDFNAWMQPIGDPTYDPSCFRLVRTSGILTVSRSAGNPDLTIPFVDQLYFTNMPPDNTGVRGLVYYTFLALNGRCTTALSPYQEVASGSYNEKFNGDFGAGIPPVISTAPLVTIDKSGTPTVQLGQRITYTIQANNTSPDKSAGLPLYNMGLVLSDSIPANTTFVAGSIVTDSDTTILYSTDGGATWGNTPVGTITNIQVWQNNPLGPLASTTFTFSVQVANTLPANQPPEIENCAAASFGQVAPFAEACTSTLILGNYQGGHFVWRDENRNRVVNVGEAYISGVPLTLYYDVNGNGQIDANEPVISQTQTGSTGYYTFSNLYTGTYVVAVDAHSSNIPYGYRATTPITHMLEVSSTQTDYPLANFGFGPTLATAKSLVGNTYAGDLATYRIGVSNLRPGGGTTIGSECLVQSWSANVSTPNSPKNFVDPAAAIGAPNGTYASADFKAGANKLLESFAYAKGTLPGTINRVVATWNVYVQPGVFNDWLDILVYSGTVSSGVQLGTTDSTSMNATNLNQHVGPGHAGVITTLVSPPAGGWNWNVISNLTAQLSMRKSGSGDDSIIYVDGAGLSVYLNGVCPAVEPNDVMTIVPLTDTFDTSYLTFVSAIPSPSLVNPGTGVITWTNVGPLNPGQAVNVEVVFSVKYPVNPAVTINNSTCVTGTLFLDNGPANNSCSTATGIISPAGYITGVVWSDIGNIGWYPTSPSQGFENTDFRIPSAAATLLRCEYTDGSGIVPTTETRVCTSSSVKGTWVTQTVKTTDAHGYYQFTGLLDGFYIVQLESGTLPAGFTQTADPATMGNGSGTTCPTGTCDNAWGSDVALSGLTSIQNSKAITQVNFGYGGLAIIYGTVWNDFNGDGTRQFTDPGLDNGTEGITVTLYNASTGALVSTAQTNASGFYQFSNLAAGAYTVTVSMGTLPGTGWSPTAETGPNADSTLDSSMRTVTLVAGQISGSYDFGYHQTGTLSIGDLVYYDFDGNGSPTSTLSSLAEGIPNVTLNLYRDNGNDLFDSPDGMVMTTTTSITGYYLFTEVPAGTYFVAVDLSTLSNHLIETADPDETGVCNICDSRGKAILSSTSVYTLDFGYQPHGSGAIGDTVWRDMNGDGLQSGPQEVGLAGVLVTLTIDFNGDGNYVPVMTRITDANGHYLFEDLSEDKYRVYVDSASSNLPTDVYGFPYIPSTPLSHTTTITFAQIYLNADFGFMPLGAIGDTVYWDANGNAQQDWMESGLSGVVVTLTNSSAIVINGVTYAPGAYQLVRPTNVTGSYLFTGLVPGTYSVAVGSVMGNPILTGDPDTNGIPCPISSGPLAPYCDGQTSVVLNPGSIFLGADFGYQPLGVIGDFVFQDLNSNGLQDSGEPGIPGVVVTATDGSTTFTTTTDFDGRYSFSNLTAGMWTVTFATPPNMIATTVTNAAAAATGNGSVGTSGAVVISSGSVTSINNVSCTNCSLYIDSGFRLSGAYNLSGHVFFDSGNNGDLYSPTVDLPYSNILVYLYDQNHNVIGTTTTDATGIYTFSNLPNGNYTVSYDPSAPKLSNMTLTSTPSEPGVKCSTCRNYSSITINNANVADQDFGFYAQMDFGDLPETYGTTLATEGPRHLITTANQVYLGTAPDADGNGQPSSTAVGDGAGVNDEDGVQRDPLIKWQPNTSVPLTVTVTGSNAYLVAWFDWNSDGVFSASERVVYGNVAPGAQTITINIPGAMPARLNSRFRLYSGSPLTADARGLAINGEVEDYQWLFAPTAVTLNDLAARTESTPPVTLPIFIVMIVSAVLLITWAKRHRVA
ncbi:Serine-aspartate repeat-containing protein D [Thermoflexales bacterium]|nr:Serine-aspartate repeat-containing protein D [Thermoflexales bacterium]